VILVSGERWPLYPRSLVGSSVYDSRVVPVARTVGSDLGGCGLVSRVVVAARSALTHNLARVSSRSAHLFTPETSTTTHYLFDNSRDFLIDDKQSDQRMLAALKKAFGEEDIPMIEAQQLVIGDVDLMDLRPAILSNDKAGMFVRHKLTKKIRAQEPGSLESLPESAES